ncbi:hypothetical protein C1646_763046 [Rhizophagus diaphanus]|nr:hypothetical protein C1646_763046 [Rhizophagus diaphanus] [Rhizophagus sp. MUCL 43196]
MINYKDIESALVEIIKVAYGQSMKKYDKIGLTYVGYLKTMQRKRDPDDHCTYVAKNQLQSVARRLLPSNSPGLSKYLTKTSWDNLGSSNPIDPSRDLKALAKTCSFFQASAEEIPKS